jgi:hypothetical protein
VERLEVIERFNLLSLGDALLQRIEIDTARAECRLKLSFGGVLEAPGASRFEPAEQFAPASLRISGVRSISCGNSPYQLNSTVVDYGAEPARDPELVQLYFDLTGGEDPEAFMIRVQVVARGFDFGPWETASP